MARLVTSSGGTKSYPPVLADAGPDGIGGGTVTPAWSTAYFRTNDGCVRQLAAVAGTSWREWAVTSVAGRTLFGRAYLLLEALPASTAKVVWFGTAAGLLDLVSVRLTSGGLLQLWNDAGAAQIGSSSVALSLLTWYRVELALKIDAGATDYAELRLADDGVPDLQIPPVSVASGTGLTVSDTQPTRFGCGYGTAPGNTSAHLCASDVAVNDDTGATSQTSWPGESHIALGVSFRVSTRGAFTTCEATNSTDAFHLAAAVGNTPPQGHADSTTDEYSHQVRHPSATVNQIIPAWHTYAWHGVFGDSAADTIGAPGSQPFGNVSTQERYAFAVNWGGTLDGSIDVYLKCAGTLTDDVIVSIRAEFLNQNGWTPSQESLLTATVPGSSVTTSFAWFTLDMGYLTSTPRTKYFLVFERTGALDAVNYPIIGIGGGLTPGLDQVAGGYNSATGLWSLSTSMTAVSRLPTTAGSARLNYVQSFICHGEAAAAGTKTGAHYLYSMPAGASTAFNYGDDVGAAGAYPGNNWRWLLSQPVYDWPLPSADISPDAITRKTDATTGVALVCFIGIHFDYSQPFGTDWHQYQKTADLTQWWAKRSAIKLPFLNENGSSGTVRPGNWLIAANPVAPTSVFAEETDTNILTLYTLVA